MTRYIDSKIPVTLTSTSGTSGKTQAGFVTIREWDAAGRTQRAIKSWGIAWGLALASILIPLAHFVLVPLFLLAGPIVAYFTYAQSEMIFAGDGLCPTCEKPFQVGKRSVKDRFHDVCTSCKDGIEISLNHSAQQG